MTGPIKPPSGPPPGVPTPAAGTPTSPSTPAAAGSTAPATFRDELATQPELPTHRVAASALKDVRLADVVTALREGRIGSEQVVDAIIDRALTSGAATTLSPPAREHLAKLLRQQLADDPAFASLVSDLGKGR